jgi:hypothetical protein
VAIHQRAERLEAERGTPVEPLGCDCEYRDEADAPIDWELTPEAEAALDALGEVPDLAPQRPIGTCQSLPMSEGAAAIYRELYGEDPDPAA